SGTYCEKSPGAQAAGDFFACRKGGKALFSVMDQPLTPAALCAASPAEASSHNVEAGQSIMPTKHGWNLLFTLFCVRQLS
ncbi:hypothetical protein ACT3TY_15700, partial [Halomonas sp. AOP22-C1-8]|uniref:hypothetical protein n=1 Tax=Halomonas sp. AOP22-C1-8 TaxID=3457717 RepID=UPI004034C32C